MMILTLFLLGCGLPLFWCAMQDYDWLYKVHGPPRLLYALIDRPAARFFYLFVGGLMLFWGVARIVNPPPVIKPEFIFQLAKPLGVNPAELTSATAALAADSSETVQDFKRDETGWVSFWVPLKAASPHFDAAFMSSKAGPDFSEGFHMNKLKTPSGNFAGGRKLYFDPALQSCDNVLFSKTPLSSAAFMMIICDPDISVQNGTESGDLVIRFYRKGTTDYKFIHR